MSWPRSVFLALLLVGVCIGYVPMTSDPRVPLLHGDAVSYAAMVEGSAEAPAPFRYRIVVPLIARALPFTTERSLAVVSWASLFATYVLLLACAARLGIHWVAAVFGVAAAAFTVPHLYNYENPHLTDATGTLVITTCVYALVTHRYLLFAGASVLGVGVRDPLFFITPGWSATGEWRRAALPPVLSLMAYAGIRWLVGPLGSVESGPFDAFPACPPRDVASKALAAWHALWLAAPVGLARAQSHRRALSWMATLLFVGALTTSFLASDTVRMFQPLYPLFALGTGIFVQELWRQSRVVTIALLASCFGSSALWQPVRLVWLGLDREPGPLVEGIVFTLLGLTALTGTVLLQRTRRAAPVGARQSYVFDPSEVR